MFGIAASAAVAAILLMHYPPNVLPFIMSTAAVFCWLLASTVSLLGVLLWEGRRVLPAGRAGRHTE